MNQTTALIISIVVIIILLVIFVISFVINKKTPIPKECEDITISNEKCVKCPNQECKYHSGDFKKEDVK